MQLSPVYLYSNKVDVFTNALDSWVGGYRKVYQRNLKVYRSVDNRIDLQVRNGDQKAVEIPDDQVVVFNLIAYETQELLLKKDGQYLTDSSSNKGKVSITITAQELLNLEPGFYQYSAHLETRQNYNDGSYRVLTTNPLYSDGQFGALGTIEVLGDVSGSLQPTTEVREFSRFINNDNIDFFYSSIIDARPKLTTPSSVHTFQIYCKDYTGIITIQGSLDQSGNPQSWIDIPDTDVTPGDNDFSPNSSNVIYKNVIGKYNWFRIKHTANNSGSAKFTVGQTTSGTYSVSVYDGGEAYTVGDQITIIGSKLGGTDGVNDLTITVASVNYNGSITAITNTGVSIFGTRSFVLGGTGIPVSGTVDKILYR